MLIKQKVYPAEQDKPGEPVQQFHDSLQVEIGQLGRDQAPVQRLCDVGTDLLLAGAGAWTDYHLQETRIEQPSRPQHTNIDQSANAAGVFCLGYLTQPTLPQCWFWESRC